MSDVHWAYCGSTGPDDWGGLDPEYRPCRDGRVQSPIDLPAGLRPGRGSPPTVAYTRTSVRAWNTGHTLQYEVDGGSTLTWGTATYTLRQFHFHAQSEHTVGGVHQPVEMHLVHTSDDGRYAVVGFFLTGGGRDDATNLWSTNGLLQWPQATALPVVGGAKQATKLGDGLDLGTCFNFISKVPCYHYTGSLTTPPCTEGVDWFVVAGDELTMPNSSLAAFRRLYDRNFRPVQPLNGRTVELLEPPVAVWRRFLRSTTGR